MPVQEPIIVREDSKTYQFTAELVRGRNPKVPVITIEMYKLITDYIFPKQKVAVGISMLQNDEQVEADLRRFEQMSKMFQNSVVILVYADDEGVPTSKVRSNAIKIQSSLMSSPFLNIVACSSSSHVVSSIMLLLNQANADGEPKNLTSCAPKNKTLKEMLAPITSLNDNDRLLIEKKLKSLRNVAEATAETYLEILQDANKADAVCRFFKEDRYAA